jgi:hypothetical protein
MLAAHSAGASVEDLIAEISEIREDELPALIAGLARELQGLDARRDELSDLRGNTDGFSSMPDRRIIKAGFMMEGIVDGSCDRGFKGRGFSMFP